MAEVTVVRAEREEESTLEQGLLAIPEESNQLTYTGDGSVDFSGNPVVKERTGRWRACPFILGNFLTLIYKVSRSIIMSASAMIYN
jgi:hypothetical protein